MTRTFFHTDLSAPGTILHTFFMVNLYDAVLKGDGVRGAGLDAHLAGDTSDPARLFHNFSGVFGAAGNPYPGV